MLLKILKEQMLLPKKEYIINQHASIRGADVLLLSFTIEKDKNCLWIMYANNELATADSISDEYREEMKTNRQELLYNIEESSKNKYFHIREMEIQGQTVRFGSSSCGPVYERNIEGKMQLQHFAEKGLIPEEWDDIDVRNIFIAKYEQMENETAPNIDNDKDLSIVLHIDRSSMEIPIQCPFEVDFGKQPIGTKITYYDEELKREKFFFVDEIYSYDIYEEILKSSKQIEDEEMRNGMLKHFMKSMEGLCPRGKNMAVIKYETEDNIQLNFMTKSYLESEPVYSSTATSIGFISNNDEVELSGYEVRECILQPVDKDFGGKLELELFSRIVQIPEEIVKCY